MLGVNGAGQRIYGLRNPGMVADQAQRGSNYGDMIDILRGYQANKPIFTFVENGQPFTGSTNGSTYITPPELNWAIWSSIIHGARGVIYFDHSFSGPGTAAVNVEQGFYRSIQPGQSISIYNQIKATNALVLQLAPVLNSPFALRLCHRQSGRIFLSTPSLNFNGGIELMAKFSNGQFYIFATTRDSETQQNISVTFTLADHYSGPVTVVNEGRTITATNGVFTDTFAKAWTVHIYKVGV